jgi:hypothetical protein
MLRLEVNFDSGQTDVRRVKTKSRKTMSPFLERGDIIIRI